MLKASVRTTYDSGNQNTLITTFKIEYRLLGDTSYQNIHKTYSRMMTNLKIDTKEKFHEITLQAPQLTANMTGIWEETLTELQKKPPYNVIMNMGSVEELELEAGAALVQWQHQWYEQSHSFVLCHVKDAIEKALDDAELLEHLNITPTLSEAWDIVQMEEIERELLDGFED